MCTEYNDINTIRQMRSILENIDRSLSYAAIKNFAKFFYNGKGIIICSDSFKN